MQATQPRQVYTVSQLNSDIKLLIEENFPFVWIMGEISNFHVPSSKHFYFTLKDSKSQIQSVMFRGQNQKLKFEPEDGMSVMGMGRIGLYEPRGSYQIIFEYLEPKGIGALQIAFDQLKDKLQSQGLFDEKFKKDLPFFPQNLSIITSPTGAVVHDILKIVNRRCPGLSIDIIPVQVQGDRAEQDIVKGISMMNLSRTDMAILARGGGSLEDLQAYNSESVARAIFHSQKPIISAIGHETDFTIADFVADYRAPTPSAAAEIAVPMKKDLKDRIDEMAADMYHAVYLILNQYSIRLEELKQRLVDPKRRIYDYRLKTDELSARLHQIILRFIGHSRERLLWKNNRLYTNNPMNYINNVNVKLDHIFQKLVHQIKIRMNQQRSNLREMNGRLMSLNPKAILNRGYSITRTLPGLKVIHDSIEVSLEQDVEVMLSHGKLKCRVKEKIKDAKKNI